MGKSSSISELHAKEYHDDMKEYVPISRRRESEYSSTISHYCPKELKENEGFNSSDLVENETQFCSKKSLLQTAKATDVLTKETAAQQIAREEIGIFRHITSRKALMTAKEIALGVEYEESLNSGWTPPLNVRKMERNKVHATREKLYIKVEGEDVPPPVEQFDNLRLPTTILRKLKEKRAKAPFKIQIQGLPICLSGRDMIGISYTGSGKTLTFIIPMIMVAFQEEFRFPIQSGEGPVGFVICPSRELARQTYEQALFFCQGITEDIRLSRDIYLRCILCIGGMDSKSQMDLVRRHGVHTLVGTPGRLKDYLHRKVLSFDHCRFVCVDEADRMVDLGFEEDVRDIWSFFSAQRQTLMFSATMPVKILQFAESALVNPITVKISRAGAANSNIIQQVEYVKTEHRLPFLLECLTRTAPPVLIFAENKVDVDEVHEYLLANGIDAVAVHGGKNQEERDSAIQRFKFGETADTLVATDVASKGLDFPNIKHVINFDMPKDIENYVHRIGRTSRGDNKGLATTFINKESNGFVLLDLKGLLKEAGQRIPPILQAIEDPAETIATEAATLTKQQGCIYCGGLGHRVSDCLKLEAANRGEIRKRGGTSYVGAGADM